MTKLTEIVIRENSMQQVLFHFIGVQVVLRILVTIKNLQQYKTLSWDKLVKKKIAFHKTFLTKQNFLEFSGLVNYLVEFS